MKALWGELKIDRYDLHARTLPVYLAIMPVILALAAVLPTGLDLPLAGASAFVFVPLCYAAGQFAADCGKRMEKISGEGGAARRQRGFCGTATVTQQIPIGRPAPRS